MRFDFEFGTGRDRARRIPEGAAMRILVVADLMGASAGDAKPLDTRAIVRVDIESFEEAFARFTPSIALPALGLSAPLVLESIDDFHPDRLIDHVASFDRLRSLRQRLQNPSTFKAAADQLRADTATEAGPQRAPDAPLHAPAATEDAEHAFERLLGGKALSRSAASPGPPAESAIDAYIRALVAPHIVATADPQLPQLLSGVDAAIGDTMRTLLHDPAFQRLEAGWRSVRWLLQRTGEMDDAAVEIFVHHITREELGRVLESGVLSRRLAVRAADAPPWSLIVADFSFGSSADDLQTIQGLARLSSGLGVPLLAAAAGSLVGCEDLRTHADPKTWTALQGSAASQWADLRSSIEARYLGLTWPRFLTRLPYGAKADPIDAFQFEEMAADHRHEDYLWGNGAFAAALAMARVQLEEADGSEGEIGDLPAFTYMEDGEQTLKPGAEFCMTGTAADEVLARGIMPLVSYQNRNAIRLVRLQSIAATAIG